MPPTKLFDVKDFPNRSIFKPREIFVSHEQLFVTGRKPNPIL